jgi:hypothetical protein
MNPLPSMLALALLAVSLSAPTFHDVLVAEGFSLPEIIVAALPAALGVFLASLLEARRLVPYAVTTLFIAFVLYALNRLEMASHLPFPYAVVWCCALMFLSQTVALWWKSRGGKPPEASP